MGKSTGVLSVARLFGPWDAMVKVSVRDLDELHAVVMKHIPGHSPGQIIALVMEIKRQYIHSREVPPVVAFLNIRTEPGRAREVVRSFIEFPSYVGDAIVAGGNFDVMIGAETFKELQQILLNEVPRVGANRLGHHILLHQKVGQAHHVTLAPSRLILAGMLTAEPLAPAAEEL